jgi:hypothetical protein
MYWNGLSDAEREAIVINIPANYYWDSVYAILTAGMGPVSQEPHLTTPFNVLYSAPHNIAVPGYGLPYGTQ